MARVLVAGLINIETTLAVEGFPIPYEPIRYPFFGVAATVSGVGFNVARALTRLGNEVVFAGMIGRDAAGSEARNELAAMGVADRFLLPEMAETPRSVILYEPSGRRMIHVDLKDIQDHRYPEHRIAEAMDGVDLVVACNINFARPFLGAAKKAGITIASDVHAISSIEDNYNRDWLQNAEILFASDEQLPVSASEWLATIRDRFAPRIGVVGCGGDGALLLERDQPVPVARPARTPRAIVNTVGAGDALFSAFIDGALRGLPTTVALERAILFAGWKIGEKGAAQGLLTASELDRIFAQLPTP